MEFIAIYGMSNFGGLGIIEIQHGIEDTIKTAFDFGSGMTNISTARIRYNMSGNPYFVKFGRRYYLDNFMRV